MKEKVIIYWMRRDLRWNDNTALYAATQAGIPVLPIFIFDKNILNQLRHPYDRRLQFIHTELKKLNDFIFKNFSSNLLTFYDTPKDAFDKLISNYDIHSVYANEDYEPYAVERDNFMKAYLTKHNIPLKLFKDHIVFHPSELLNKEGKPFLVYTHFANAWKKNFTDNLIDSQPSEENLHCLFKFNEPIEIVPYETLGFKKETIIYRPLNIDENVLKNYHLTRDKVDHDNGTTNAGMYLRFGTISIRYLLRLARIYNETYLNELIWREFFQHVIYHFPYTEQNNFQSKYDKMEWENDSELFEKWKNGQTGFPIIDAAMRELNNTGYMHNRCRMIVANFLSKILLIDWRWGEQYFAEKLMDYELASNVGNWQWAAGTGVDAAPYFRIFNPFLQQEKFDPEYRYVTKHIPEFRPDKYLPFIVDYNERRKKALRRFQLLK